MQVSESLWSIFKIALHGIYKTKFICTPYHIGSKSNILYYDYKLQLYRLYACKYKFEYVFLLQSNQHFTTWID